MTSTFVPTIKDREAAIYAAQRHQRATTPLSRSRILAKASSITLVMRYLEAFSDVDKTRCQAQQEREADEIVSRKKGWPTIEEMRHASIDRLRKVLA